MSRLVRRALEPTSIVFLVYLRVIFGALNLVLIWLYYRHGLIERYYVSPAQHFTYPGFGWVHPWPGDGMYWHYAALAVLSALVTVGLFHRAAIVLLCVGLAHLFLIEQARYLNHYYLNVLIAFLLILVPAHRAGSLDALRRPTTRAGTAPTWTLWLLRFQVSLPYVFGGIAKIDREWLRGLALLSELRTNVDRPIVGPLFATDWIAPFMSWGGLLLDLLVVPLLLWRRTRVLAFTFATAFHLTNATLFRIDIFPWFMIGATYVLFFPDRLPFARRVVHDPARGPTAARESNSESTYDSSPDPDPGAPVRPVEPSPSRHASRHRLTATLVGAYVIVQILVPLRHHLYPGVTNWTDHGHDFAWRMMLRAKSGHVRRVRVSYLDPQGRYESRDLPLPSDRSFWVHHWQYRKVAQTPDMILQLCHWQAARLRAQGCTRIDVRVDAIATLNGRPYQPLIDPGVNLAEVFRSPFESTRWIMRLTTPPPTFREALEALDDGSRR